VLLFVFEFLGTTELIVILLVALMLFGPRRLPEIGRTVGKSLAEFKRATDDFKRTWEREVELDKIEREMRLEGELSSIPATTTPSETDAPATEHEEEEEQQRTIARGSRARQSADSAVAEDASEASPRLSRVEET
jgi:sec-independent protein translocase protein TatB